MRTRSTAAVVYFVLLLVAFSASVVNLLFVGIEGNPVVLLTCVIALMLLVHPRLLRLSHSETSGLIFLAIATSIIGAVSYNQWTGLTFTPSGSAVAFVMLSGYVIARFLLRYRLAYTFSAVGFLVILVPALFLLATEAHRVGDLFVKGSQNYVTSWLIITSLAMSASRMAEGDKPPLWPAILAFLISVSLYTRSSIIVSFLALLATIYIRLGIKWAIAFAFAMFIAAIPFGEQIGAAIREAIEGTKFGRRGLETPRWEMWSSYMDHMSFGSILLGTNTDYIPVISDFGGNAHNSVIRFHAFFGIIPLVAGLYVLTRAAIKSRRLIFFPVALILVRSFSDEILVGTVLDVFLMIALVAALQPATMPLPHCTAGSADKSRHTPARRTGNRVRSPA